MANLPENHFCRGCPYGRELTDRVVCPFVAGSCARYPWTIMKPDLWKVQTRNRQPVIVETVITPARGVDYPQLFSYNGEAHTLREWSDIKGIVLSTLRHRMSSGWRIADAIERGVDERLKYERKP